jgi:hypothetical protein
MSWRQHFLAANTPARHRLIGQAVDHLAHAGDMLRARIAQYRTLWA